MYFITKNDGNRTKIMGAASDKEAAQGKLRAVIMTDVFGASNDCGADVPIGPIFDSFGSINSNGHFIMFRISEFPDEALMAPILEVLAENFEKYGLTGKQKSQVENLLKIFKEESKQGD